MRGSKFVRAVGASIFAVFVGSSGAACGDGSNTTSTSSTGGDGGAGGGSNSGSNAERYVAAFCGRAFDCCNTADLADRFKGTEIVDYAGCRIAYRTIWEAAIEPVVAEGEKAGRVVFNQANFDACMTTISGLSCADFAKQPGVCENIFTPKVPVGQACLADFECIDGTCEVAMGASAGTCQAKPTPAPLGGACTKTAECQDGLYCEAMKCATVKADGVACTTNSECASNACVGGTPGKCATICEGGGPGAGAIDKTLETLGGKLAIAECSKAFECCAADEISTVLSTNSSSKSACLTLYGVLLGFGLVGLHNSSAEGKLTIDATIFESCIDKYANATCTEFSKNTSLACPEALKGMVADGSACTDDPQCTSKFCNEPMPNQGTCAAIPGAGAPCTDKCVDGYYCKGGTCAAKLALGGACTSNGECIEGRCYGPMGMPKTCALICDGI